MVFNLIIGFTQWTSRLVGKNLPKQIWGRKDRGLLPDVRGFDDFLEIYLLFQKGWLQNQFNQLIPDCNNTFQIHFLFLVNHRIAIV